jgi:phosphatidate cytidylyltransferase
MCFVGRFLWSAPGERWSAIFERNAKPGIMVRIYGLSHVPALLLLNFPELRTKLIKVFFPVIVVQVSQLAQHLRRALWRRVACGPTSARSINGVSLVLRRASARSLRLAGTPFVLGRRLSAFVVCVAGALGISDERLKRDRRDRLRGERGKYAQYATGAGGLLKLMRCVLRLCFFPLCVVFHLYK